jgi:hypothetical protein
MNSHLAFESIADRLIAKSPGAEGLLKGSIHPPAGNSRSTAFLRTEKEPRLPDFDPRAVAGITLGRIDRLDYVDGKPGLVFHPRPTTVPRGAPVLISGWAIEPMMKRAPRLICILVDRTHAHFVEPGSTRGNLGLGIASGENIGYDAMFSTIDFVAGPHEIRVFSLGNDTFWYEASIAGFHVYCPVYPNGSSCGDPLRFHTDAPLDLTAQLSIGAEDAIPANHWILLHGWAMDHASRRGVAGIVAEDAGGRRWVGASNLARPDVNATLQASDDNVGFEIVVPAGVFACGRHELRIVGLDSEGRRYPNPAVVTINVTAAEHPFPVNAREATETLSFAAECRTTLEANEDGARDDDGDWTTWHRFPLSAPLQVSKKAKLAVRGWALDEAGHAAGETFLELAPFAASVPPLRLCARSGRGTPMTSNLPEPPAPFASFACDVISEHVTLGDHALSLVVVNPGRRSIRRAPLGTLKIVR